MKLGRTLAVATLGLVVATASAHASLAVTEIMSKSGQTEDWFEVTNYGESTYDVAGLGLQYIDSDADFSASEQISGLSQIAPGESVVVLQLDNDLDAAGEINAFRSFWGGLNGVQIATLSSGAKSLGKNDAVVLFGADGVLAAEQSYDGGGHAGVWAGGEEWDSANFTGSGWVAGSAYVGQYGIFASSATNGDGAFEYGSPGVVPEPGTIALLGLGALALLRRRK